MKGDFTLAAVEAVAPEQPGQRSRRRSRRTWAAPLGAPDVDGTFGVTGGRLRVEDARVSAVRGRGPLPGREAIVERASARVLGGSLLATGSDPPGARSRRGAPRGCTSRRRTSTSRASPCPAAQRAADSPSFLASVSGDLEATAPGLASLRGEGRITRLESRSTEGTFGLAAPAPWRLRDGRLVQEPLRLAGPLGTLEASADVALVGDRRRARLTVAGPFDLRLLSPFLPDTTLAGPGDDRPARELGRVGQPARRSLRRGRRAGDPRHAELQRLAAEGRGALPRRPRGDRRDRRRGRRPASSPTAG